MATQDKWGRGILQQGILWGVKIKTTPMIFSLESCLSWTAFDYILGKFEFVISFPLYCWIVLLGLVAAEQSCRKKLMSDTAPIFFLFPAHTLLKLSNFCLRSAQYCIFPCAWEILWISMKNHFLFPPRNWSSEEPQLIFTEWKIILFEAIMCDCLLS